MRKIVAALIVSVVGLVITAGVYATRSQNVPTSSENGPSASVSTPSCLRPSGAGPGFDASIGNQQNNKTICISTGERLLVLLSAGSANATPWSAIRVSKTGLLGVAPLTMMLSRGLTGRNFKAIAVGTLQLSSQRRACPQAPPGGATCEAIELWRVTIDIVKSSIPSRPTLSVIYGKVTQSPTCPVQRAGQNCLPAPVSASIEVRNIHGRVVASTRTNTAGNYTVGVQSGKYTLAVVTGRAFPRCPHDVVTLAADSRVRADISCDTGIR